MNYRNFLADPSRPCSIVAHRGVWRDAPENSLLAISRAIEAGYDAVEIDVRRSADGEFVLLHDDTLARMTGDPRAPEDVTAAELEVLRLRHRDGGARHNLTGQKLPRLRDVFALTRDRIFIHLDIKNRHMIGDVIALAQATGVDQQVDVWADLKSEADVAWVEQTIKPHGVAFVARTRLEEVSGPEQLELMFDVQPDVCELSFRELSQVAALRQRFVDTNIPLWINTLDGVASPGFTDAAALADPEAVWGTLLDAGFSVIQTDEMAALSAFIAARASS